MRGLAGEVEDGFTILDQIVKVADTAQVGEVDLDAILDPDDVCQVAAMGRDQAVKDQDISAKHHQTVREG